MADAIASPFIASLGDFSVFSGMFGAPMFAFAQGAVEYLFWNDYFRGVIDASMKMYLGTLATLVISLLAAAYIVVKTTAAAISFIDGFAFTYRGASTNGDRMGLYELIFTLLFLATALTIIIFSFVTASNIWELIDARVAGAATEGIFGTSISNLDMFHFGTIGMVYAIATWTTAFSLGETADELIGWFDDWTDAANNKRDKEGCQKTDTDNCDADGTSIGQDFLYHAITVVYSWVVFTGIMVGSVVFANEFIGFSDVPEDCDLTVPGEQHYANFPAIIATEISLPTCRLAVNQIFQIANLDKEPVISRCNNAKFLYGIGNTEEYARKYAEVKTLPNIYQDICYERFPADGSEVVHE